MAATARNSVLRRAAAVLVAIALLGAAAPARAHDFWIEPSTFRPSAGAVVRVALRVGDAFPGEAVPRSNERIVRFVRCTRKDEKDVAGVDGGEPAGMMRIDEDGLCVVGYRSTNARVELEAPKFESYLREQGLDEIVRQRKERGESGKPGREQYSRCAKALLLVGEARGEPADRALGLTLELVAETNPYALKPGDEFVVRLLHEGKPVRGALVAAAPRAGGREQRRTARSDAEGRVRFRLEKAGFWLISSVRMARVTDASSADWESYWASLTFEVGG